MAKKVFPSPIPMSFPDNKVNLPDLKASIPSPSGTKPILDEAGNVIGVDSRAVPAITDQTSGKVTGVNMQNGASFLGIEPKTANTLLQTQGIDNSTGQATANTSGGNAGNNQILTPEMEAAQNKLAQQQNTEQQQLTATIPTNQQPMTTAERNAAAGKAFLASVASNLGLGEQFNQNIEKVNPKLMDNWLTQMALQAIGFTTTANIGGVSFSTLFSSASGNIKNLQGDIADNVAESKNTAKMATSRGSDVLGAIQKIQILEDSARFKYNQATISLRESPKDIKEGLDLQDEMARNLQAILDVRHALERYYLTGDVNQVLATTGV